jgi:ketosteroid isomerase-like protein
MRRQSGMVGLFLVAGLALTQMKATPSQSTDTQRVLLKMEEEWGQVDVNMDKTVLARVWAPNYVSIDRAGGITYGREANIANFGYEGVTKATNVDMRVHVFADNVAVVTGIDRTEGKDKDGHQFVHEDRFSDTWVKRGGLWQCVAGQVTRIR